MKHFMQLTRVQICGTFKVTIKIFDKTVQPDPLSVTVVEDIPKGLKLAIKYPL